MVDLRCGNLHAEITCNGETASISGSKVNPAEVAEAMLNFPPGTQIVNPDGNVVITMDGSPDKWKVKIPAH